MHTLLARQLRRYSIDPTAMPASAQAFLRAIADAYDAFDADHQTMERSLDISSRELMAINNEMRSSSELLRATLDSTADGILAVDSSGHVIHANARFTELWRIPDSLLDLRDDAALLAHVIDQIADPEAFVAKVRELYASVEHSFDLIEFKDGQVFERYSRPLMDHQRLAGRVWSFRDITEKRKAELALQSSEQRFRALVQHSSDMIIVIDAQAAPIYVSPSVARIMGYSLEHMESVGILSLLHPEDLPRATQSLSAVVGELGSHPPTELRLRHADGAWRDIELLATNLLDDPAIGGIVYNARDVTERKALEEQLRHQAFHDPLTAMPNRALFSDRLEQALKRALRTQDDVAVLFMDVDNFKSINDTFGHGTGDRFLQEIAERIGILLRPGDTAARFGGDEFALLIEDLSGSGEAIEIANCIITAFRLPFHLEEREIFVGASIGIAISDDNATAESLLRDADVAMYVAKGRGKARVEVYRPDMYVPVNDKLELLADLQRAIECDHLVLQYQPTFDLITGGLVGAEALVRWNHPERGLIQPLDFISLAEESGMIQAIGRFVLRESCFQLKRWQHDYPQDPPLSIAVNVSGYQLQTGFVEEVRNALVAFDIEPSTLTLEITESVMMRDVPSMIAMLVELKGLGLRLAIDDFGTGYSSLSYLRQFPFDILKIDKSFVDDAGTDVEHKLTGAIVEIGKTLGLKVVAEGIEHADQLMRLRSLHCDIGQGYYFARPLFLEQMNLLLASRKQQQAA